MGGRGRSKRLVLAALIVAGGAGTLFAQIGEVVVALVAVGPGDVHARAGGDVNLHVHSFFPGINGDGHGWESLLAFRFVVAALSRGDGIAVRAGRGMAEK